MPHSFIWSQKKLPLFQNWKTVAESEKNYIKHSYLTGTYIIDSDLNFITIIYKNFLHLFNRIAFYYDFWYIIYNGAVAHLVEHYNGIVEVVGSSPISSSLDNVTRIRDG